MSEAIELDLSALHAMTSEDLMKTAQEEGTIKTGTYITKATKAFARQNPDDADYDAGRVSISLSVTFYAEDATTKVGTAYLRTSPEARFTSTGKLDAQSKRYAELAKAVGVDGANPGETVAAALQTMFKTRVREVYVIEDASDLAPAHSDARPTGMGNYWVTVDTDDSVSRDHYIGLGLEARVQIDRVTKL